MIAALFTYCQAWTFTCSLICNTFVFGILLCHSSAIKPIKPPAPFRIVHINPIASSSAMSDEDDFAFDDWDDATLAELDATEQRISFQLTQIQAQSTQLAPPTKQPLVRQANFGNPPAKRLKPNNWSSNAPSNRYASLNTEDVTEELEVFAGRDGRARIFDPEVPPRTTSFAVPSRQIKSPSPTPATPHELVTRQPHAPGRPPPLASQRRPSVGAIAATIRESQCHGRTKRSVGSPEFDSSLPGHHRLPSPVPQSVQTSPPPLKNNSQVEAELSRLRAELAQVGLDHTAGRLGS